MTELLSAAQAKEISENIEYINEEEKVACAIEKAAKSKLVKAVFAAMTDKLVDKLRGLGYIVGKGKKGIEVSWEEELPTYEEVADKAALEELISGDAPEVYAELTENMELAANERIEIPAGKKVTLKVDNEIKLARTGFAVADGAELVLTGKGTIKTTNKSTSGAVVEASGANALVTIDGVTIDCISEQGKAGNYTYAIYLMNDASLNFKSGVVKVAYGSGISTNNTTGGNTVINITGGELYSDGAYAIYLAAQGKLNIKGGKVQGINARMGIINISGDAEIIPTTMDADNYDNIGVEFKTSGCVWVGDTIAIMGGTYSDPEGTDCVVNVLGNATVKSAFRSAIGVYMIDLKESQNISINVANKENVATTDADFEAIKVYDHEYIATEAAAHGKTYVPVAESVVTIK